MTTISMEHDHHDHDEHHDHDHGASQDAQLWVKVIILLGLGIYFIYNIATGNLTNYINLRFAWLSYVAAALFLLTGLFGAYHLLTAHRAAHSHDDDLDPSDHVHGQISWAVLAVVAVPLVLGTFVPSRPLGADAVSGNVNTTAVEAAAVTTVSVPPLERNVLDWLRAFSRETDLKTFDGQPADVIGFVYKEPTYAENQFMVARFSISCCVADATAIGLPVTWADSSTLPQGQWVRVQGIFSMDNFHNERMPVLQAGTVETVEQPEHPYLYP